MVEMRPGDFLSPPRPRSRRDFLRHTVVAAAGGSIGVLAGCGGDDDADGGGRPADTGGGPRDVEVLNAALDLEYAAAAAYSGLAGLLEGEALELGRLLAGQEEEHANGIAQAIRDLGGTPGEPRTEDEYADELGIADLRDQRAALRFALDLEDRAVTMYIEALPKLTSGPLRGTVAAIVTNEAQHISVLLELLGREQLPGAFVTGRAR